ncbi:uncharacterized protein LOC126766740 [Bactrocera neohumeralis]|uniref:uncharacterized protein LOC126766740 n=1 Tax=Bactrocera neohumeralis TaxID=98809 RepID=UPI002165287F|nr:uncharacterized protein LOC126766740 [Bactrocera neohumeralis]
MAEQVPVYTAAQLTEMLSGILHSTDNNERRSIEGTVMRSLTVSANLVQLQQELRRLLLAQLGNEPVRVVRFAIAHIVSRLAKADADHATEDDNAAVWPELQQAIRGAAEDPRVEMRELSMVLVYSVAEVFYGRSAFSGLAAEAVVYGLADSETSVQSAAVKAVMMLLPSLATDAKVYVPFLQQVVPQCLSILTQHAAAKDGGKSTALCVTVLDLMEQLLDDLSVKKNGGVIAAIVNQLLLVLSNPATNPRVRQNCGTTLAALVSAKPKFVVSQGLLGPMVQCCVTLMSEDATISLPDEEMMGDDDDDVGGGEDGEDDDEDLDMLHVHPVCRIGVHVLISLASAVANATFASALMPFVSAVVEGKPFPGVQVEDPLVRKSAILAMACLAEGNPSYLRRRVGFVLRVVKLYFADSHPVVRESAAFALSSFCLHLQPEILTHHAEILPMLVSLLSDPSDLVRCRAADALDTLCENLAEDLEPYLSTVLPAVLQAIGGSSLFTQRDCAA